MKTGTVVEEPEKEPFKPVTLWITFETQQELDEWTCFFNSGHIADLLGRLGFVSMTFDDYWQKLRELGGNTNEYGKNDLLHILPRIKQYVYELDKH